jgi:hypothetical protein
MKTLWQAVLERSPPVPCGSDWNGAVTPGAADKLCSVASLALVDDTCAEVEFGMSVNQDETSIASANDHHLVVSRLLAANHASVIEGALGISQRNIQAGDTYKDIWTSRFRSLASARSPNLKKVSIVDRYAIEQHFRCPQQWLSGLERFLRLLDADAGGARYVKVYSAWTADLAGRDADEVKTGMNSVMQKLPKANVKRLTVNMVPNQFFGTVAHDRYVRFGNYAWELGFGLGIFEGPSARNLCQASFKSDADSHLRVERALERETRPYAICIRR